jgi:hypothetical protein
MRSERAAFFTFPLAAERNGKDMSATAFSGGSVSPDLFRIGKRKKKDSFEQLRGAGYGRFCGF